MIGLGTSLNHFLPDTAWATYTYILVSYHLILAFKVFVSNKKAGLSLPLGSTILSHSACVALLIGFAVARHQVPFFGIVRYFIPGLAPFEAEWLFNGEKEKALSLRANPGAIVPISQDAPAGCVAPPAPSLYAASTGEDFEEFLKLMQQGKRPFRKPGISVRQEYELWLAARNKARAKGRVETTMA